MTQLDHIAPLPELAIDEIEHFETFRRPVSEPQKIARALSVTIMEDLKPFRLDEVDRLHQVQLQTAS